MSFVKPGDLVMVTESLENVPTSASPEYVPTTVFIPEGTMGVIMGERVRGTFSVITGLGLVRLDKQYLKRLGMALPSLPALDWPEDP